MNKGISIANMNGRRVVSGLGYYEPKKVTDLRELVKGSASRYKDAPAFKFKDREGNITGKTYVEFERDIDYLGTALLSMGLKGAREYCTGENRYEWCVCYFSILNGTGVAVPLDKNLPRNEVENLLERGSVEVIFYTAAFEQIMKDISKTNDRIKYYINMENVEESTCQDPRFLASSGSD